MNDTDRPELPALLESLCNDRLTDRQHARLQELLRDDPEAQQTYLAHLDLHLGLQHIAASEADAARSTEEQLVDTLQAPARRKSRLPRASAIAAGVLAITAIVVIALLIAPGEKPPEQIAAQLTDFSGNVLVYGADGESRAAALDHQITAGERVETQGPGSLAVVSYADGTRVALVNDSSATLVAGDRKQILLHQGVASAQVAPQPAARPMLLATPGAQVEVLGTRFAVSTAADRTELNVSQGRVRLTRVSDGQTVEVAQGQGIVTGGETGGDSELTVRESGGPRGAWEVDFERGAPQGWTGRSVYDQLPPGSKGAIQAVRGEGGGQVTYVIESRDEWVEGLFAIHEDSHLHFTMKMEHPNWLNVFMMTRGADAATPTWAMHNFNEVPFWPPKSGQWRTVTIPLSQFRRKRDGVFYNEPPVVGEVAYTFSISALEPDRGLVIDRIWVTRGGPGEVTAEVLP